MTEFSRGEVKFWIICWHPKKFIELIDCYWCQNPSVALNFESFSQTFVAFPCFFTPDKRASSLNPGGGFLVAWYPGGFIDSVRESDILLPRPKMLSIFPVFPLKVPKFSIFLFSHLSSLRSKFPIFITHNFEKKKVKTITFSHLKFESSFLRKKKYFQHVSNKISRNF